MLNPSETLTPRHPALALLARYRAIFSAVWAVRHELAGPKRLADEAAFLPAALSLQETPVHPAPRRFAIAICALFVIALVWSIVGHIDIVAVAQGRIIVSQRSKLVQPLEAAVVTAIHVKDGDRVQQGQLLIELDATAARADGNRVAQEHAAATSEAWRTAALMSALTRGTAPVLPSVADQAATTIHASDRPQLDAEWADITARLSKLGSELALRQAEAATVEQQIAKVQATLPLLRQREQDVKSLADQGFMSSHAGQDRARERMEMERDLATLQARQQETLAALRGSEQTKRAYQTETQRVLRDRHTAAELTRRQLHEEATKTAQRTQLTQLTAPVAGTVQQLAVHTSGGVVTPAQVLLVVVPHDAEVTAEVTLDNKDVGFVREGQAVTVKLETFPYTRYGTVPATVTTITADAVNDEKRGAIFPAVLRLGKATLEVDGRPIKLSPGMNLTAEIKTGRRRVIDYLMSPVQRSTAESFQER